MEFTLRIKNLFGESQIVTSAAQVTCGQLIAPELSRSTVFRFLMFLGLVLCFLHVAAIPIFLGIHSLTFGDFEFPMIPFLISFAITITLTITFSFLSEPKPKNGNDQIDKPKVTRSSDEL